jgi:hypothetical protein
MKKGADLEKTISTRRKCPKKHEFVKIIRFEGNQPISYRLFCPKCNKVYSDAVIPRQSKKTDKHYIYIQQDKRELVKRYMGASSESVQKTLKKEILRSKDSNIDKAIENSLLTVKKEAKRKRLLEVAVQRNPEKYLKEFYEIYSSNKLELKEKFKNINFNKSGYKSACLALVGEISPYPQILLSKVASDERMQELIREEVKKGVCPKYYLDYLSSNRKIILEPEIQEKVYEKLRKENPLDLSLSRYLDLNSRIGLHFINSIDDLAIAYGILKRNTWGIEEDSLDLINADALIAYKIQNNINLNDMEKGKISNFLDDILLESSFRQQITHVKNYVNVLSDIYIIQ